ncbi:hypothetical protein Tco_1115045 [Tanacetum coccineum]
MKNDQMPLTLDYKTFCQTTRLDYNNGDYVAHPSTEVLKDKLAKITTNEALVQKTLVLKTSFPVAWRILLNFVIQVLSGNHSSAEQLNPGNTKPAVKGLPSIADEDARKSSPLSKAKTTDPQDTKGNIQPTVMGFPATHPDEGRNTQLTDRGQPSALVIDISRTGIKD